MKKAFTKLVVAVVSLGAFALPGVAAQMSSADEHGHSISEHDVKASEHERERLIHKMEIIDPGMKQSNVQVGKDTVKGFVSGGTAGAIRAGIMSTPTTSTFQYHERRDK